MRRSKLWAVGVVVALALSGCGDDTPTVTITEADPVAERRPLMPDTSSLGTPDSTIADSALVVDSVEVASIDTVAAPPDFAPFWTTFQAAVRSGNVDAVTRYAKLGEAGLGLADVDHAYITAFTEPFKTAVLSLSPRDFERDETAREVRVVVGFDAEGRVVPEDEADTDESIRIQFDVVDGRYRWVGFAEDA
ncbi:MAG: hypothetical protein Rubg2KO_17300 [Rubricoccaceae bacterium]